MVQLLIQATFFQSWCELFIILSLAIKTMGGGFKSKKSKAKVGNTGGPGRPSGKFARLDEEEKREYFKDAVYMHRHGTERPKDIQTISQSTSTSDSDSDSDHDNSTHAGRPPLHLVAMSPNKLRVRMNFLNSSKRKEKRLSEIRRAAALKRWNAEDHHEEGNVTNSQMDTDDVENDGNVGHNESDDNDDNDESVIRHDVSDGDDGDVGNEEMQMPQTSDPSRTTLWRRKCQMRGILTKNPIDNLHILLSFNRILQIDYNFSTEIRKINYPAHLTAKQYRYRAKKMKSIFESSSNQCELMVFWLDNLLSHNEVEAIFNECSVILPSQFIPRGLLVSQRAANLASEYISCSSKTTDNIRLNGVKYVVQVAKDCELSSTKHGDGTHLAKAVACSVEFAEKVLRFIEEGREEELYKRRTRVDAIKCTEWPALIKTFVFLPENSRSVPGQQQVSVRYGVRLPKYILLRSRESIASDFKLKHPDCPFKVSTIMREFPQNAITPTSRDAERNTCPKHANVRRLITRINRVMRKKGYRDMTLPNSCRVLATTTMCSSPVVSSSEPTIWVVKCATNKCTKCPGLKLNLPDDLLKESITYSLWASKVVDVTKVDEDNNPKVVKKTVFSLYPETKTVGDAVEQLREMMVGLRWHIYTAHRQWTGHDVHRSNLDEESIITIEDYQMNMEVVYRENPTSLAYSTNKKTVALYPICVEFLNDHGQLCKGAIAFLSEDKKHDHQQVEEFELRAFEIIRAFLNRPIKHWKRFSDGCAGQFRSRFVSARMWEMKKKLSLSNLSYDLFEAHEGKNTSDTIGSIVKCAFLRGMYSKDEGISSIGDMVSLIISQLNSSMKKFKFFNVESFGFIPRKTNRNALVVPEITKIHSIVLSGEKIIPRYWTCLQCRINKVCSECLKLPGLAKSKIKVSEGELSDDNDDEQFHDSDDDGATDQSDSDESDTEVDEDLGPGDIVWALYGRRWYPARLVHLSELPDNVRGSFKNPQGKSIVKWYGEDRYSLVRKVDNLAENRLDAKRAGQSKDILQAYNLALEDLNN